MFLFDFFRSFLPLRNPLGFGVSDFVQLAIAALLVALVFARARIEPAVQRLAARTGWSMLLLGALPVVLRLLLLPHHPAPTPGGSDDFSYVLLADTLRQFRLANPTHPMHRFFEANFVLQEPSYSSIFPMGQGIAMALGWMILGHPWAGVMLSVAALCALCYWMLRAWTTPGWALTGGLLAVCQFGPLTYWMNSYWGGAVAAAGGCLLFGTLPRWRERGRARDAVLVGAGLGVEWLTRPYESLLLGAAAVLFCLPARAKVSRTAPLAALLVMAAVGVTLFQNKAVTGSWTTLPYRLSQYQYGVPASFTFEPNPAPHRQLTAEQQLNYEAQVAMHGKDSESIRGFVKRLGHRVRFGRFFWFAPLYLALPFFAAALKEPRFRWVLLTLLLLGLGANFYPYFYPHYVAGATCLLVLVSVTGLERLSHWRIRGQPVGQEAARLILFLCGASFLFWYGLSAGNETLAAAMRPYETWDYLNSGDPEGRLEINQRLAEVPGRHLVFVRYWPQHLFHEWIHNAAEIDSARVVWANDLGAAENARLAQYFPDCTVWLVEPDAKPPRLTRYAASTRDSLPDLASPDPARGLPPPADTR